MSQSTLPADWTKFLQEIEGHIERALAAADLREQQMPTINFERRDGETDRLQECLVGLRDHLDAADQVVQEVDSALLASEQHLRQQAEAAASLRLKLAAWAGRAIG